MEIEAVIAVDHDIRDAVVALGVQLKGIEGQPRLIAEDVDIAGGVLEVQVEAGLHVEHRAVIEADHGGGKVFHGEDGLVHHGLGDPAGGLDVVPGADLIEGGAEDGDGLGVAHDIAGQVDDVDAQVDQRAAAGAGLVAEPAAGEAAAAQVGGLGVVDVAEEALLHEVAGGRRVVAVTADEAQHQQLAVFVGGLFHGHGLFGVHSHGLFAQHVTAGVERGDGTLRVGAVPGADADQIRLEFLQHGIAIGIAVRDAVTGGVLLRLFKVDVAAGHDLHRVAQRLITAHVAVADAAAADNADFQCHNPILRFIIIIITFIITDFTGQFNR